MTLYRENRNDKVSQISLVFEQSAICVKKEENAKIAMIHNEKIATGTLTSPEIKKLVSGAVNFVRTTAASPTTIR